MQKITTTPTTVYYMTKKRDGQLPIRILKLSASTMDEAEEVFSFLILNDDIAKSEDYYYIDTEDVLHDVLGTEYIWQGKGYYLTANAVRFGREEFYSDTSIFSTYREDVYTWAIESETIED